jgi:hypothetical protein
VTSDEQIEVARKRVLWAAILLAILLAILTLAGLDCLYWLSFSVWMLAYPFAQVSVWRIRFYIWLIAAVLVSFLWLFTLIWLIREIRRAKDR